VTAHFNQRAELTENEPHFFHRLIWALTLNHFTAVFQLLDCSLVVCYQQLAAENKEQKGCKSERLATYQDAVLN